MDPIYIVIITILMALAVCDLIVGVSNDAVNFLNSALGSKAAPRYVIMIVASVGILLGSIFSSGMMEIARSGVFHPSQFDINSVMMIFLAVMFKDVILLDILKTIGLPTSTTVSL
ncbi:MAG: inorganic phosphate transporter, partial [Mucinivorans sp.]